MDEEHRKWLATLPPIVRAVAERFDPDECYRMTTNSGHYTIVAFSSDGTLKLAHGRDSYDPGIGVFGVNPDHLILCGCGKWRVPSKAQIEAKAKDIEAMMLMSRRRHN